MTSHIETISKIKEVIQRDINFNTVQHAGRVKYVSYNDGDLLIEFEGACVDCDSVNETLTQGIIPLLKKHVPDIINVSYQFGSNLNFAPYNKKEI